MGSGAFLVEACRALAIQLVEAWGRYPHKKPVIPADEDAELHAKRLVAQRCLYGVDKNPLATDLAKLSLWLATLARDHEFTFLDHALKSGDSVVGLTQEQIAAAHWDTSKPGLPLFRQLVKDRVAEAMKCRAEIQAAPDDTARAIQEQRHHSLEGRLKDIRLIGDAVIAAFFAEDGLKAREKKRAEVESWLTGSLEAAWDKLGAMAATLKQGAHPLPPFHWGIEFPEVFTRDNPGFDAIVGNPPFLGGSKISSNFGAHYLAWLLNLHAGSRGNGDLVAHFFRRAFGLLRTFGTFGLIATKTIGQGDTRASGLEAILSADGAIIRAIRRLKWPGEAAVTVSIVHVRKGGVKQGCLDGVMVRRISAYLVDGNLDSSPFRLAANSNMAFAGTKVYGAGFVFDDKLAKKGSATSIAQMEALLTKNAKNRERIFPYIGGDDLNSDPQHLSSRYVIDFSDFSEDKIRKEWPDLVAIVEPKLKESRGSYKAVPWWQFERRRPELYSRIAKLSRVTALSQISVHLAVAIVPNRFVFDQRLIVITTDRFQMFCTLQSRVHEVWTRAFCATLEDRLSYNPSDCFQTFAFSSGFEGQSGLAAAGRVYHDRRAALMVARNEGMTKTYNRFHDRSETSEDTQRLRELHAAMDRAVLEAYGWRDLAARSEPIFLDQTNEDDHTYQGRLFWPSDFRDEVLARLLALNAERHAEEVRLGIAPGMKGKQEVEEEDESETD
jgi:hypothetical protein